MYKVMKSFVYRGCMNPVTGTGCTSVDVGVSAYLELVDKFAYCNSDFKRFIVDDLATLCKNLVNFGPETLEFKRLEGIQPSSISSLTTGVCLLGGATARHCRDKY